VQKQTAAKAAQKAAASATKVVKSDAEWTGERVRETIRRVCRKGKAGFKR